MVTQTLSADAKSGWLQKLKEWINHLVCPSCPDERQLAPARIRVEPSRPSKRRR